MRGGDTSNLNLIVVFFNYSCCSSFPSDISNSEAILYSPLLRNQESLEAQVQGRRKDQNSLFGIFNTHLSSLKKNFINITLI